MDKADEVNKYEPISQEFLESRGKCCGSGCLMCPYDPPHVKGTTKKFSMSDGEIIALARDCGLNLLQDYESYRYMDAELTDFLNFCHKLTKIARNKR
jgi:hypothetical protein